MLWVILVIVILALGGAGYWLWWFMRRDIEKVINSLLAKFIAKAIKKGDVWEEETKAEIIAKLKQLIKLIESIDIIKPKGE